MPIDSQKKYKGNLKLQLPDQRSISLKLRRVERRLIHASLGINERPSCLHRKKNELRYETDRDSNRDLFREQRDKSQVTDLDIGHTRAD
jgi:hypothetical protein